MVDKEKNILFKKRLLELRTSILNKEEVILQVQQEDLADESDLASSTVVQEFSYSMKQRDLLKLREISDALNRLMNGSFGVCQECSEPIEEKRLTKQPLATLCILHAEEKERQEVFYKKGVI
jgi:DnaK suppressor protein